VVVAVSGQPSIEDLRDWLRYHGEYDVELSLWGPFGCYVITVKHGAERCWSDMGMTLDKRLANAMAFLIEDAKGQR
jgi:hypothetical protein